MMRRYLATHLYPSCFGFPHQTHSTLCTHVSNMIANVTDILCEQNVARDNDVLGNGRPALHTEFCARFALVHWSILRHRMLFAMLRCEQIEHLRILQNTTHDLGAADCTTVIGDHSH